MKTGQIKTNQTLQELITLRTQLNLTLNQVEKSISKFFCVAEFNDYEELKSFIKQNKESLSVGDEILLRETSGEFCNVVFEYRGIYGQDTYAFFVSVTPGYEGNMNVWLDK